MERDENAPFGSFNNYLYDRCGPRYKPGKREKPYNVENTATEIERLGPIGRNGDFSGGERRRFLCKGRGKSELRAVECMQLIQKHVAIPKLSKEFDFGAFKATDRC